LVLMARGRWQPVKLSRRARALLAVPLAAAIAVLAAAHGASHSASQTDQVVVVAAGLPPPIVDD
jgi:hypothetical protein